jgi:hypothetical protein
MQGTYKPYENQHPNVEKYSQLIALHGPYRFFTTLTFQYFLSEKEAIDSASQVVVALRRKLLEMNWPIGLDTPSLCPSPGGIAVLEKASSCKKVKGTVQSIRDRGNCHFHFLLHDHPKLSSDPARGLWELGKAWREAARGLNYKNRKKLVSVNGTDAQLVATTGLFGYVLKEAKDWAWKDRERLFLLDGKGLIPVDLSQLKLNGRPFRTL